MNIEQVRAEISEGKAHLWPGKRSAAVCGFMNPLGLREYHVWLAGGDLNELREMEKSAEGFARQLNCDRLVVHGRKGWLRALAGYVPGKTITKEL